MPKGRYSRRAAVVCNVPEAKEVSPASGRPNAARPTGGRSEREKKPESPGPSQQRRKASRCDGPGEPLNRREPLGAEGSGYVQYAGVT
jgi:hypothetical protein